MARIAVQDDATTPQLHRRLSIPDINLYCRFERPQGAGKRSRGEDEERARFEPDDRRLTDADCGITQHIHVPRDRVRPRQLPQRRRQRLDRVEHRAGEQQDEVKHRRHRVEHVVAADDQREDRIEEEPSRRAGEDRGAQQRQRGPSNRHSQHNLREDDRHDGLRDRDQQVEQPLAEQVLGAPHRVGQHLEEDAVVAVHEKRPRRIRRDAEARHAEHAGEKEGVVVDADREGLHAHRLRHAHAEHQQVPERIEQIPEDERQIRRANLAFAIHDGRQGAHEGTSRPAAVSSMKISSRLAPDTSILSTRPMRPRCATRSSTRPSCSRTVMSAEFCATSTRIG